MRITHYLPEIDFEVGGPVRAVLDLCRVLSERGHEVTLMTRDDRDVPEAWRSGGEGQPTVHLLRGSRPAGLLPGAALSEAAERIERSDALHVHGAWTTSNLQLARIAKRMRTPYLVSPRGMLDDWPMSQKRLKKRAYLAIAGRRFFREAAFVHCTAEDELRQSSKWFPRDKGRVIPNLLDLDPYRELPSEAIARAKFHQLTNNRPTLLFLSRIHVKKGIEHLINAAAILKERGRPCDVLIAGKGETSYVRSLESLAERVGVTDLVSFLGLVVGDEKLSLYRASDVFVLPTFQENFGFVLVESLAAGTPVVTTREVGIWREIEASGGGRVLEKASGETVAEGVIDVLDRLPETMGARGRDWVFGSLDPKLLIQSFEAMYADAAKITYSVASSPGST
jgi:glycosyltransferase involved in cell wall biosynthesis